MKNMKKLSIIAISLSVALLSCTSPNNGGGNVYVNSPSQSAQDVTVNPTNLGANLDLQALGELVKSSQNAQDIEKKLNAPGSINNLDLSGSGKVDYISVTEYGDNNTKGFSFTVDLGAQGKQEVATVTVDKTSNQANMNISGNQAVYGSNASYNASYPLTDFLILSYMFSYHPYYRSPYYYGYYPSYYHSYAYTPYNSYHSRMNSSYGSSHIKRSTTTTTTRTTSVKSPNSNASSNTVAARSRTLSNPTTSQKSFSARPSGSSTPRATGFGSSRPSSSSSSSSRPSSSSSSRSSSSSSSHSSGGRHR